MKYFDVLPCLWINLPMHLCIAVNELKAKSQHLWNFRWVLWWKSNNARTVPLFQFKMESIKWGSLYYLQRIILLQLSVAYALQRNFQLKGGGGSKKKKKKRNKNLPDDKVLRCRMTLNQQLMSEQSKPHTQSSNNPRFLVQTWTFKKVQETKDWHVDESNTGRLTELLWRKRGWEFKQTWEENYKSSLMRPPANLTMAHRIFELPTRHSTLSIPIHFCPCNTGQ